MKIAILYIATGRYSIFWNEFYTSCEKYFLKNMDKTYFLFTDDINIQEQKNIKKIKQKKLGWPYDTMMRFDMFLSKKEELKNYDYIFFFNANTKFMSEVGDEILPTQENDGLVTATHHGFYDKQPDEFTYDRNPNSMAYIPYGQGKHYATGALNGGIAKDYLLICEVCSKSIHIDLENEVIALWHDESHLNRYLIGKNPLIMSVNYLYPETIDKNSKWNNPNEYSNDIKILSVDKTKPEYGGHDYLREIDSGNFISKLFSVKKSINNKYYIVNILGLKIKLKK